MKNILWIFIAVAVAFFTSSCKGNQERPTAQENVYIYTFESAGVMSPDDSKALIEKFLGTRNVGDLHKSDENKVYYVSNEDVSETFEHDLNNRNLTFNKSIKKYLGNDAPQLPSKEKAIRLAEDFLTQNALLPRNREELKLVHFGGVRASRVI